MESAVVGGAFGTRDLMEGLHWKGDFRQMTTHSAVVAGPLPRPSLTIPQSFLSIVEDLGVLPIYVDLQIHNPYVPCGIWRTVVRFRARI